MTKLKNDLLIRVINKLPVERVPVWIMRQAGRTDPEYNKIRKNDGRPLEKLFQDPEISIKISLLPKRLGVDAIIMFQDILTPLTPAGAEFRFIPGPFLKNPIRDLEQIKNLRAVDPEIHLKPVAQIIKGLNKKLSGELPVLGFAGSPMTLAFFMISGSNPKNKIKKVLLFLEEKPEIAKSLLNWLTELTVDYLNFQIESGAHVVQLFESFAEYLELDIYKKFVQPTHEKIFSSISKKSPSILFTKESTHIDLMIQSGASVLSVGKCVNLSIAKAKDPNIIFQGNINNKILADGTKEDISEAVKECFFKSGRKNHILNLNHGLLERTPFENVKHFVKIAKEYGRIENNINY
tara:strand:+ start:1030 stop:2079 length:1050 start_codon:yes stop_codon:yes gene_type:complete